MRVLGLAVAFLLLSAWAAFAQAAVNPKTIEWTAPTTNADGTPLTDLGSYNIRIRANAVGPVLKTIAHPSATLTPAVNTTVTHGSIGAPLNLELNLPDGSYLATVTAVDTLGNESVESGTVPFASNRVSPAVPTGVTLKP